MRNSGTYSEGRYGELMQYCYPSVVSLSSLWDTAIGFQFLKGSWNSASSGCCQRTYSINPTSNLTNLKPSSFCFPWTNHQTHMTRQRNATVSIPPIPTLKLVSKLYGIWTWMKILKVALKAFQGCCQGEDTVRTLSWLCLDHGCMEMKGL